jgi:hypothetical protein
MLRSRVAIEHSIGAGIQEDGGNGDFLLIIMLILS